MMSMTATNLLIATRSDGAAPKMGSNPHDDVVEIQLLLPSRWTNELIDLARERGQSVGELLRSMIGQKLRESQS